MNIRMTHTIIAGCCGLLLTAATLSAQVEIPDERNDVFDELSMRIQQSANMATESEVLRLLDLGQELGRNFAASLALKTYLRRQTDVSPRLLRRAIDSAVLSADYPALVARCKAFLSDATPGAEASEVAGLLLMVQIDYRRTYDDAYNVMLSYGGKFRQHRSVAKYDQWFLSRARVTADHAGAATHLAVIFAEKQPLERERLLYWDDLDWLIGELKYQNADRFVAAASARRLAGLIRSDPGRALRLGFFAENLAFYAGSTGKEQEKLVDEFKTVAQAAMAYVAHKPTSETLGHVVDSFSDGDPNRGWRDGLATQKRDFYVAAFSRLPVDEQKKQLAWKMPGRNEFMPAYVATPDQWAALARQHPEAFRGSDAGSKALLSRSPDPQVYKQQAQLLAGVPSREAAIINSMGAGDSLDALFAHLVQNESWHLPLAEVNKIATTEIWPRFEAYPRDEQNELPLDALGKAMATLGEKFVATSPMALDPDTARTYIVYAWRHSGEHGDDKSQVARHLASLNWVPYDAKTRESIFAPAIAEFTAWSERVRTMGTDSGTRLQAAQTALDKLRQQLAALNQQQEQTRQVIVQNTQAKAATDPKEADKLKQIDQALEQAQARTADLAKQVTELDKTVKKGEAEVAKDAKISTDSTTWLDGLSALDQAFRAASALTLDVRAQGPNPLCEQLARVEVARLKNNRDAFLAAARQVYPMIKAYREQKLPGGLGALQSILRPSAAMDISDFHVEVLTPELAAWQPTGGPASERLKALVHTIVTSKPGWGWGAFPARDHDQVVKLNDLFAKTLMAQMDKGQFSGDLFQYILATRHGSGWNDKERNSDVIERMITEKTLLKSEYRYAGKTAATSMMSLLHNQFPELNKKYPYNTSFDDLYVEEVTKTRVLDDTYRALGGSDSQFKVRNVTATIMQDYATPAVPYGATPAVYGLGEFWTLQSYAMSAQPAARDAMLTSLDAAYGKTRFDTYALGMESFATGIDYAKADGRKTYFARLKKLCDRIQNTPLRPSFHVGTPQSLDTMTAEEIDIAVLLLDAQNSPDVWVGGRHFDYFAEVLSRSMYQDKPDTRLAALAPAFWRVARDTGSTTILQPAFLALGQKMMNEGHYDMAVAWARAGYEVCGRAVSDEVRSALGVLQSRALSNIKGVIPVKRSDPRYPLFAAQANYNGGNEQGAWTEYMRGRDILLVSFRELDPLFVMWLIDRNVELENFDDAEAVARAILQDMESNTLKLPPEIRVQILLSYANIAFHIPELPRARAQYERIGAAAEFDGLNGQVDAQLRIAEIDRVQKDYDGALQRIDTVLQRRDDYAQTEGHYQLALVLRDQELYTEALGELDKVLQITPGHIDARLTDGRIRLTVKQLEVASDLDLGMALNQKFVVPGKVLKVRVIDKLRRIVKRTTTIEITIWAESGDEETFSLVPWADSLERFQGEIPSALAAPVKGDYILQLLGVDTIHYDFSERFKELHNVTASSKLTLGVLSDSELYASSGEILTGDALRERQEEENIRRRLAQQDSGGVGVGVDIEPEVELLSESRLGSQVKPGNSINVLVLDDDRSISPENDELAISVSASSGDSIQVLTLTETNGYAGIFEGTIPTELAPATAFATDSDEGTDPNFPISGGEYPPWVALPDNHRPKFYGVDMNDSVFMQAMRIEAGVPGRKIKEFFLQTSLNGQNYKLVGSWPQPYKAWGGSPVGVVARYGAAVLGLDDPDVLAGLDQFLANTRYQDRREIQVETLSAGWTETIFGHADALRINWDSELDESWYIARFSAAFYTPLREHRTLVLKSKNESETPARFALTVDGELGTDDSGLELATSTHQYKGVFKKGAHRIDVYVAAQRRARPSFQVHIDTEEPPYMELCPALMFDIEQHPEIREYIYEEPATITANEDGSAFEVAFSEDSRARAFRMVMFDFETDAPAIGSIQLDAIDGTRVLPTEVDLMALRDNKILEIIPGDQIKIAYEDPRHISENSRIREVFLSATFADANVSPQMVIGYGIGTDGTRVPLRSRMLRYKTGDSIDIIITDPDGDVSKERDSVEVKISTTEGQSRTLTAVETEKHSGTYEVRIFPVDTEPQRETEILVSESDDIVMEYLDRENTDPGIPWTRAGLVEQVWYQDPELRSYSVTSMPIGVEGDAAGDNLEDSEEFFRYTHTMVATRPETPDDPPEPQTLVHGGPVMVELLWPTIAQHVGSTATLYAQTTRGRAAYTGVPSEEAFDINVPGTIKLSGGYGTPGGAAAGAPGYDGCMVIGTRHAGDPLDDGRFVFGVPYALGDLPEESLAIPREEKRIGPPPPTALMVGGSDGLHIGFHYTNDLGEAVWITRDFTLHADAFFDVMDRAYQTPATGLFVDETVYFRARDVEMDSTEERDAVTISLNTSSGFSRDLQLTETAAHAGTFKGLVRFVYAEEGKLVEEYDEGQMPVRFGDEITMTYQPTNGRSGVTHTIEIFKGSDGDLTPFTKRFRDVEIAVKTQLSIAEAYFEMAKKHRKLGQKEMTEQEISTGKKILEEALRDFPESEARAQGDYLLANLSLELAEDAEPEERMQYYNEALLRFTKIVGQHRESTYAPKAQYKKALTLEKMEQFDAACEEYVKLSYRWPENELIAETIARLGQYFFRKGDELKKVDSDDPVEIEKAKLKSHKMFTSAAEVFARLAVRFPTHKLAEKTTVLSGQCYMRAENYEKAIDALLDVIEKKDADKDVRSEAMYWCGDCYTKVELVGKSQAFPMISAYRMFKRLTWDYPATQWAKYARARLTEGAIAAAGLNE